MKTAAPTSFQSALITRALDARRYTQRHKLLWRALYKQANKTKRTYNLTWSAEAIVEYWLDIVQVSESPSSSNTVALDDLLCGFRTIAQESNSTIIPIDSLEEFGDTWVEGPSISDNERLETELEWLNGVHAVTEHCHLPRWCDGTSNPVEEQPYDYEPLVAYY
jgi:hypothetical protein